jgi:dolichyl-diphosphooligosaccharide--protein glycosyltransferase
VRIYAVKKEDSLGREHKAVTAFDGGRKLKKSPSALDASGKAKGRPST